MAWSSGAAASGWRSELSLGQAVSKSAGQSYLCAEAAAFWWENTGGRALPSGSGRPQMVLVQGQGSTHHLFGRGKQTLKKTSLVRSDPFQTQDYWSPWHSSLTLPRAWLSSPVSNVDHNISLSQSRRTEFKAVTGERLEGRPWWSPTWWSRKLVASYAERFTYSSHCSTVA